MRAAVFHGVNDLRLEDVDEPKIGPKDVLIRVKASSICGTDLHIMSGRYRVETPIIIGHEYSGVVEEVGEKTNFAEGDRVIGSPICPCGECCYCIKGEYGLCLSRMTLGSITDGSFAEYMKIPSADLVLTKLPDRVSFSEGALIGDLLATAFHGVERGNVQIGDTVAVFGAGPIGLTAMLGSRIRGASRVIAVDVVKERLKFAEQIGADFAINARVEDPVQRILELTGGVGADVVIEAVGSPETISRAISATKRAGNLSVIGVFEGSVGIDMRRVVFKMLKISGTLTRVGPDFLVKLTSLVESRRIDIERLITHRFSLQKIHRGFEIFGARKQGCVKVVINP
jgi:alcohol dehydrogenase